MAVAAAAITPAGVRDGEHATLRALTFRRGTAVLDYCEQVCAPGHALDAASEAFARFRATVVATASLHEIDPEAVLLSATRHAAAARAPAPPAGWLKMRVAGSHPCQLMPELLAARADDQLSSADRRRMDRHLRRCGHCQTAERRSQAAEVAYRAAFPDAPAAVAVEAIERALRAAAPTISPAASAGPDTNPQSVAAPWPVPPLAVAEPPELPVTVAPAPRHPTAADASEPSAQPTAADPESTAVWPATAGEPSDVAASLDDAPRSPFELEDEDRDYFDHYDDDERVAAFSAPPLDDDPDATMAWALDAPDFEGEIVAGDLRDRDVTATPGPPDLPGAPEVSGAGTAPDMPVAPRRRRLFMRRLLPVAIAAVVVLVALSLVGSLANSDHHRSLAPRAAPTIAPAGVGGSAIITSAKHARRGRARRRAPAATGGASASAAHQTLPTSAAPRSATIPVLTSPTRPRNSAAPQASIPTSPRSTPVSTAPAGKTPTTPPTAAGTIPSGPPSATPPATPGASAPSSPASAGGTTAPAP